MLDIAAKVRQINAHFALWLVCVAYLPQQFSAAREPIRDQSQRRTNKDLLEGFTEVNLKVVSQISDYKPERVN